MATRFKAFYLEFSRWGKNFQPIYEIGTKRTSTVRNLSSYLFVAVIPAQKTNKSRGRPTRCADHTLPLNCLFFEKLTSSSLRPDYLGHSAHIPDPSQCPYGKSLFHKFLQVSLQPGSVHTTSDQLDNCSPLPVDKQTWCQGCVCVCVFTLIALQLSVSM